MLLPFAIVTGANCGLGLHLVKALYASGTYATIVLACRSEPRANAAIAQIVSSGPPSTTTTQLEFVELDLASKESVRSFVDRLASVDRLQKGGLRLLVNNAGVMGHPPQLVDRVEVHFAANHLGHFSLTNSLLNNRWFASDARILIITSGKYEQCHSMLSVADLTRPSLVGKHSAAEFYAFSKLSNCLFAKALGNRHALNSPPSQGIKVVAVRPGFVRGTELGRHTHFLLRLLAYPLIWWFSKNLDQGISTMLHCAQCDAHQLENGALYYEGQEVPYNAMVTDEAADELWEMSIQMD